MNSLRGRLIRGLATILLILFASHWLAADSVIRYVAENQMLTRLEHDGDSLLYSLTMDDDGRVLFDADRVGLIYSQPFSGHYFIIQAGVQEFHSPSMGDQSIEPVNKASSGQSYRYHATGPQGQPLLALTRGISREGQLVSLTTAEDLTEIGREIGGLRLAYLVLTVVVLGLAIALQSFEVRRALRPLAAIREDLRQVERGQKPRIDASGPSEIQPLVEEINRLLMLVARRLQQCRVSVGNLAHALKNPLSILFRVASDPSLAAHPSIVRQLRLQTAAMHNRLERELKRARLSGAGQPSSNFNPQRDLEILVQMLQTVHADKQLEVELRAPDGFCTFDRDDMLEVIGNLADNACKWAARRVIVDVACEEQQLLITVEDDGPGCPEAELRNLTQRGLRLDEAQPGHGLGLAIVRDITDYYGGSLVIARSQGLGGLRVTLRL